MDNLVYKNEKLSKYSWFGLGGSAKIFFKPKSALDLKKFLEKYNKKNKKIHILGVGSNTLFRDSGFDGVIIKLGVGFNYTKLLNNNKIEVGAATLDKKLSDFAKQKSITGFEFLSCIPGSVGGAITMNSGCYDHDISQIFFSLKAINFNGNLKSFNKDDVKFFYRGNNLPKDLIVLSAVFEGRLLNKKEIESRQIKLINQKKESQPSKIKTCGSTFKNPQDKKHGSL